MGIEEFDNQFDVLFNNITSNQAPGLNSYEKSVFLTKAEKETVKNHFSANSTGNTLKQGFDDSAKRQADFSSLMKTDLCSEVIYTKIKLTYKPNESSAEEQEYVVAPDSLTLTKMDTTDTLDWKDVPLDTEYTISVLATLQATVNVVKINNISYSVTGLPFSMDGLDRAILEQLKDEDNIKYKFRIDPRSALYTFPNDVFIPILESLYTSDKRILQVVPIRYDEYSRLMSKPFKRPLKNQAWRLMNSGETLRINSKDTWAKNVEIVTNSWDEGNIDSYVVRYIRTPKPIIVADLDGLTIDGYSYEDLGGDNQICEIDPILHEDILQRAVELAKISWTATGQDNVQTVVQAGERSE